MRRAAIWIAIAVGGIAGFGCAELILRSVELRNHIGKAFDRGDLLAIVGGHGIYQVDVDRQLAEADYVAEAEDYEATNIDRKAALAALVADVEAETRASHETIPQSEQTAELNTLRFQFADDKTWRSALEKSALSPTSISRILGKNLRTREWLDKQIASKLSISTDECRQFYDSHHDQFFLPERRNVSHLFLAAPPETPPDVVKAKRSAVEVLSARLAAGEDFATLVAQNSEDEATKLRGGELGYFSAKRMPPDFVEAAAKMQPGEISKPVRTRLGFHILKLIDVQAPRQQVFDEVRDDIVRIITNEKRSKTLQTLSVDLRQNPIYLRPF